VPVLTATQEHVIYELSESKTILEQALNKPVEFLAWLGDSFTKEMIDLAIARGYKGLFMAKTTYTKNILPMDL